LRGVWFRHRSFIDVHRHLDLSMTHEFLLHFHRRAGLVKPGAIGMAEGMPADIGSQLGCFCCAFDLRLLQAFLVIGPFGDRIGENAIRIPREKRRRPPLQEYFRQTGIERNLILRVFRLKVVHSSAHDTAVNQYGAISEIEAFGLGNNERKRRREQRSNEPRT
jgi:hypothetical protein